MSAYSPLTNTQKYGLYSNTTTGGLIKTGTGNVQGIIVNSHTNGKIVLCDALSPVVPYILNTNSYASGSQVIPLYGAKFLTGLWADTGGTTQNITIIYN